MTRLPLFPLTLVLFPGQVLPLHIFEERYKEMLQRCLDRQEPFGIVLIKDGGRMGRGLPHSIGTTARVLTVEEVPAGRCTVPAPHKDSCFHITCRGEERFRVAAVDRREASYLVGDLEPYPDEPAPPPAMLMVAQRVSALFDEYYREVVALMGGWQKEVVPGERTMMFDMATLVSGQSRLQSTTSTSGESVRTIPVPSLPEDPAVAGQRYRRRAQRHADREAGAARNALGAGAIAARGRDPRRRDAAAGRAPAHALPAPLQRVRARQLTRGES